MTLWTGRVTMRLMSVSTYFSPVALLYYLCFLLLAGMTAAVGHWGRCRTRSKLRRSFVLLSASLLAWVATLFLEVRVAHPDVQLWLGRANFAAVAWASFFAWRFVQVIPDRTAVRSRWPLTVTLLLAVVTAATRLVSAAEQVVEGHAVTTFGPLAPLYLLHVHGFLTAALIVAVREWRRGEDPVLRRQLGLVGLGMLVTGAISATSNSLLPYLYGDFRFCDVGTLSTLAFVLAVGAATFFHGLFDLRVILRETLVYGLLLTFVLGAYSSAVFVISQHLTANAEKWTQFVVLLLAFSFDPLRRFLEKKTDQFLFGGREGSGSARVTPFTLALLFPWRRE